MAKTQSGDLAKEDILTRIETWAGGEAEALHWYRSCPIPAFDGRTAEALVKAGQSSAIWDYLDNLDRGACS
ncbi:DUF2384 domain-containing protein [Pannonibacter indicus]|uniref:Antitoxin Xre/MbcA/ParS-like toxin-binding domain-containing protein n=1 Tax=Pannonibacter indicus TaxID=466044 RepID=A0A0K6I0B5_9HYPH|nr:DUF2384 domain-containing protein [Pannonibacter indicus]CUA96727.1 hypothetical protein Ga0061067_10660 [Pannonibacter indicus]